MTRTAPRSPRAAATTRPMLATLAETSPAAQAGRSRSSGTATNHRHGGRERGGASDPQGSGLHGAFRERGQGAAKALKRRRTAWWRGSVRSDEDGRPSFSAMRKGQDRDADRLLSSSTCSGRGRADHRPTARRAPKAAREAARQEEQGDPVLRELRRRAGTAASRQAAEARRDHGQAARVEVPPRQAHARLAEDQAARPSGVRDRGLHEGPAAPLGPGLARARRVSRRELVYVGNVGHRVPEQEIESL